MKDLIHLSEEELATLRQEALEFAEIGLYAYRFDGTIVYIDRGTLKIFDLESLYPDPKMVCGRNLGDLFIYNFPVGTLRGQVLIHGRVRNLETNFKTFTGIDKWVSHDAFIVHNPQIEEDFIQVVIRDITKRKKSEEALQQAYNEIELRAQERSATEREQNTLLDEVLDNTLSEIQRVVPHDTALIALIENGYGRVVRYQDQDGQRLSRNGLGTLFLLKDMPDLENMVKNHRPIIIEKPLIKTIGLFGEPEIGCINSYLGAPIYHAGQVTGIINLTSTLPGFFKAVQAERLQALADQAAVAIHNARLYLRVQELATSEERQRLARELHDAVSQTLWTASLIAHVLPANWEIDPEEGRRNLVDLQRLTRGALSEMRTLLHELRPSALEQTRLGELMQQLAQAVMSRKEIDIQVVIEGEAKVPPDIKIGLYRLTQEALNNAAKHAHASQAQIHLRFLADQINLTICDNGRGFDTSQNAKGLGLGIMHERAEAMGANLEVCSEIGAGTEVRISLPIKRFSQDGN